ncbi:o-succinylbenzoate--CoA ligase [Halobacillus litoralis]|uniref:2-succinylbenzoate--CoA ligase n=1 Tax=Halobacillus litoralis TaxID=45668 RepID=A0A845E042_9BACI|nr:o-succinylbenzoate--CoA ligase [Halobacillus litoralis]MYL48975.1 o-succinylbenzoate--CoA ligase [Halobacillus litoralis]
MGERIPHWLDKQAALNPLRTAIEITDGKTISFSELREESRKMAYALMDNGVEHGDHVAFLASNSTMYAVFIHAVSYIGAVAVLLNTRLVSKEITYQLTDAHVSHFYVDGSHMQVAMDSVKELDLDVHRLEHVEEKKESAHELQADLDLDDVYTMMYTSGTTGNPKAVMHTYGNHWHSAVASALNLGTQEKDKWLNCLPLFHVGGFSILMKSVVYGMPIMLLEKFDARQVHEAIMEKGITHVSVVTVMLQRLLEVLEDGRYPGYFRCMLLGGGPVPEVLLNKTSAKGIPVFQTYGMTETSSQIATLSPEFAFSKLGSAGKALSPAHLYIDCTESGEVGEIIVRGPMVSKGYYNRPEREGEYLRTGDLGFEDEDGFLYVVDRVKDVIISGGENIYPAEVESVLLSLPGVREAGVAGRPDERWGEVPAAYIVTEDGARLTEKEVMDWCRERLAKYKCPKEVHWIDEIPRNASNKLVRRRLSSSSIQGGDE